MKKIWLSCSHEQAITLSLVLHLLLLCLAYCHKPHVVSGTIGSVGYTIAFQASGGLTLPNNYVSGHTSQEPIKNLDDLPVQIEKPDTNQIKNKYVASPPSAKKQLGRSTVSKKTVKTYQAPQIDQRGLYNAGKCHSKQTDATLELKGWTWDVVPRPNDLTEECGKIVFEIKVDENGEIIAIKTIEKTVTPLVEKIYADALRILTFSKTGDSRSTMSTGKVTFVLVAK